MALSARPVPARKNVPDLEFPLRICMRDTDPALTARTRSTRSGSPRVQHCTLPISSASRFLHSSYQVLWMSAPRLGQSPDRFRWDVIHPPPCPPLRPAVWIGGVSRSFRRLAAPPVQSPAAGRPAATDSPSGAMPWAGALHYVGIDLWFKCPPPPAPRRLSGQGFAVGLTTFILICHLHQKIGGGTTTSRLMRPQGFTSRPEKRRTPASASSRRCVRHAGSFIRALRKAITSAT